MSTCTRALQLTAACTLAATLATAEEAGPPDAPVAQPRPDASAPPPTTGGDLAFDWLRHANGEWLKGELVSVRNGVVEFESDEFGTWNLDVEDIAELYTASRIVVSTEQRQTFTGQLVFRDGHLLLDGQQPALPHDRVVSAVPADRGWWKLWDGEVGLGFNLRRGNTDQADVQTHLDARHRTIWNRLIVTYRSAYSEVEDEETANNHRATARWDYFIDRRLFLTPARYEYYRDIFQNIKHQHTAVAGGGYELVDAAKVEWNVDLAAGYQHIEYRSVPAGEDEDEGYGVLIAGTTGSVELTDSADFDLRYQLQQGMDRSARRKHYLLAGLDVDITGDLELFVNFQWDRNEDVQERDDGTEPEADDYTLTTGLTYSF